ncbi:MAG TPA: hypothetical protein PKJ19_13525 [Flavobacteriales bacterium]|nr:hypothetical protein [Flavobacteriales bacterium]
MTAKRNPGRPRTAKGQRSVRITITLHPDEYEAIKAASDKPTTFIREAALREARK